MDNGQVWQWMDFGGETQKSLAIFNSQVWEKNSRQMNWNSNGTVWKVMDFGWETKKSLAMDNGQVWEPMDFGGETKNIISDG